MGIKHLFIIKYYKIYYKYYKIFMGIKIHEYTPQKNTVSSPERWEHQLESLWNCYCSQVTPELKSWHPRWRPRMAHNWPLHRGLGKGSAQQGKMLILPSLIAVTMNSVSFSVQKYLLCSI